MLNKKILFNYQLIIYTEETIYSSKQLLMLYFFQFLGLNL